LTQRIWNSARFYTAQRNFDEWIKNAFRTDGPERGKGAERAQPLALATISAAKADAAARSVWSGWERAWSKLARKLAGFGSSGFWAAMASYRTRTAAGILPWHIQPPSTVFPAGSSAWVRWRMASK